MKDDLRRRLQQVKEVADTREAVDRLVDVNMDMGIRACQEREVLRSEVERLRVILVGNGDPNKAVVAKMEKVVTSVEELKGETKRLTAFLLGSISDDGTVTPGLMDEIREIVDLKATVKRITWIVLGVAISDIVLRLIGIL